MKKKLDLSIASKNNLTLDSSATTKTMHKHLSLIGLAKSFKTYFVIVIMREILTVESKSRLR